LSPPAREERPKFGGDVGSKVGSAIGIKFSTAIMGSNAKCNKIIVNYIAL
jgi:hypothetical protein